VSTPEFWGVALSFLTLIIVTLLAQFKWLGSGMIKTFVVFIAGIGVIAWLWVAGIPPAWFAGTKAGFSLGGTFTITSFLPGKEEERSFRFPLFLGMGLTLLVFNFLAHV